MVPTIADPLKKREEFAVSLRKKKKHEILTTKRKRFLPLNIQVAAGGQGEGQGLSGQNGSGAEKMQSD